MNLRGEYFEFVISWNITSVARCHLAERRTTIAIGNSLLRNFDPNVGPMPNNLSETIALLSRTPSALNALLRDLPEVWIRGNEGANTWSPFDVIGHLIHGERTDWMPRAKMILQHGESKAFDPFDRFAQEKESRGKSSRTLCARSQPRAAKSAWPPSCPRSGYAFSVAIDLGRPRPHASSPNFEDDGPSIPRCCRPLGRLSRSTALRRAQFVGDEFDRTRTYS